MWHIKGFIPGFGYCVSQYCCWKKKDMASVAETMEREGRLSNWKLVYRRSNTHG